MLLDFGFKLRVEIAQTARPTRQGGGHGCKLNSLRCLTSDITTIDIYRIYIT